MADLPVTAKFKVHGFMYEPGTDNGSDANGYIHFYDVVEAINETNARQIAWEDYGDYNTLEIHGVVASKADEKAWLAKNPS